MADSGDKSQGMRPPPFDSRGHPLPRRASPDKSITLHNHRLARDASSRVTSSSALGVTEPQPQPQPTSSPTRRSSGESNDTGQSDPKNWFDQSNRNPVAAFNDESPSMEVDPPFYQKETDSSNEESRYPPGRNPPYPPGGTQMQGFRPAAAHSTAADDFRSVIDDLTVENKRLKEELKRYKQFGSDMMRKEKLFEIKVHGLPKRKKRELEATLRDFAASLGDSSESTSRRKTGRHGKVSLSKHDSSSSSRSRPVDSAYATMSTGRSSHAPHSSGPSLGRPSLSRAKSTSSQKVESYLRDTPDGLLPHHIVMTDKEKKKLVVRRLEQLFTGKISGRNMQRNQSMPSMDAALVSEGTTMAPPRPPPEGLREACIQLQDGENPQKVRFSKDNASASNSGGDQTELGGTGTGSGDGSGSDGRTGNNTSPPGAIAPDQRPTRPRDLDPDRVQIPSENMDYIRHLGLVSPEFLQGSRTSYQDVAPDAEGWVYLNLLCNLAQLHIVSVTPSFIRQAVSEKSTKFQLSSDGRKIRWRGGTDGTKFSSDSSEDKSQKSPLTEDTEDGSDETGRRKKQKTQQARSEIGRFGPSRSPSDTFHYKPMFVHRHSSSVETSLEESASQGSEDGVDESNLGNSKWDFSGSGTTQQRRKRRYDGAIVYYTGVPFCTDLSGDPGDMSPTAQMTATGRELEGSGSGDETEHVLQRTLSGSSLPVRPLSDDRARVAEALDFDPENAPDLVADDGFSPNDEDFVFPWCEDPDNIQIQPLAKEVMEPSGLGGVLPDDHFAMFVTTRRVVRPILQRHLSRSTTSEDTADIIAERLASIRTSSPLPPRSRSLTVAPMQIEYVSGEFRRLNPASLPPPAIFYPPFSTDSSWDDGDDLASDDEEVEEVEEDSFSEGQISRRANPHFSDNNTYMRKDDLVFDTETDVRMDSDDNRMSDSGLNMRSVTPRTAVDGDDSPLAAAIGKDVDMLHTGSSVATAGGAESGYSSSMEDEGET